MDNKSFDKHIKQKLAAFQLTDQKSDWEQFSQLLDAEEMAHDEFDNLIKQKLTGYEVAVGSDWNQFSQSLDEALAEDQNLDQLVQNKLDQFEIPYDPSTWPPLRVKLELEEKRLRELYRAKAIELAFFLLLLITIVRYMPYAESLISPAFDKKVPTKEITVLHEGDEAELQIDDKKEIALSNVDGSFPEKISNENKIGIRAITKPAVISDNGIENGQNVLISADELSISKNKIFVNTRPHHITNKIKGLDFKLNIISRDDPEINFFLQKQRPVFAQTLDQFLLLPVYRVPNFSDIAQPKKRKNRIGVFTSADINLVYIPQNKYTDIKKNIFVFESKDLATVDYGGGFQLLYDFGKFTFQTGLSYYSKQYSPKKVYSAGSVTQEIRNVSFENIEFNIVQLPVNMQYYFNKTRKWKPYLMGGFSLNVIAKSYYDVNVVNNRSSAFVVENPALRKEVFQVTNHFLNNRDFNENAYFTANFGLGLERSINSKISLYLQPSYHHMIFTGGIGPNRDKIQSVSLQFGSRVSF